ncbi:Thioredoxin [Limihaloglobus sulfuriphilus]|uniref:Thioredoxin n=1 Tax=Limihaloglobus sulfuriphilus TaxID=1851148 RepID=A0A1Q2MBH4_9BACT|nr:thioredoxin family protein [Limihaloglobus sulfuriphilus]AQQ70010.1 Thioredoxin [Limihaloglobus sulfuriphilus]
MNNTKKAVIVIALIAAAAVVIALKKGPDKPAAEDAGNTNSSETETVSESNITAETPVQNLPRMVDLGADKCIPCKMMKPILDELKQDYKQQFEVIFIDVWKNPDESKKYNINLIPTQIFYSAAGEELFRHEGFYSKEDILAKWKELGIDIAVNIASESN